MKNFTALAAAAVFATSSTAWAEYPPTASAPAGYPPTVAAQQQPQQQSVPAAAAGSKVQVFPFEPVGTAAGNEWVGKGIQAGLQSDVSHTGATLVLSPGTQTGEAVATAKANGATLAVTGTYQVENGQVRADGHLIDTATGQPVGSFSGKAPVGSVFQLEDALGEQLKRLLPTERPAAVTQFTPAASVPGGYRYDGTPLAQPAEKPTDPATVIVYSNPTYAQPAPTYAEPVAVNNYYPTSYASYGYPYAGYYGVYDPFVFGFGFSSGYYGGYYGGYRGNYSNRGYGYNRGFGNGGYVQNHGGGRSFSAGGGRSFAAPSNGGGNRPMQAGGGRSFSGGSGGGRSFGGGHR